MITSQVKSILYCAIFAGALISVAGCEILTLRAFPESTLEQIPEFPIGEFANFDNDRMNTYRRDHLIGFNAPSEDGSDAMIAVYALEHFRGFCMQLPTIDRDELDEIKALNPELAEEVEIIIESSIIALRFGMVEVYGDAFLLMIPHQPAFEGIIQEMGATSFKADLPSMYTSTILAVSPEELVEVMDRALPTNMFIPMAFIPAEFSEDWNNATQQDIRAQVRTRYPKLMDRLEEVELATKP